MGVYTRPNSSYYWMWLERPGGASLRESTRVKVDAANARQRRDNRQLAETIYHTRMAQLAQELHALPTARRRTTFATYATWYATNISALKRGHARELEILAVLTATFGAGQLHEITADQAREWITARRKLVAPATVNRELDLLKHVLASAVPTYLDASPIVGLRRVRVPRTEPRLLTPTHERKLLAQLMPADRAIVIMALDTLMRLSDIIDLQREQDHGRYLTVLDPKTEQYRVPVSTRLRAALNVLPKEGPYFFPHRRKAQNPRDYKNSVKSMLKRACARAKIPYGRDTGITFHALRHTGASRMLARGVDIRTVQEIGGWASLRQLTRYTHPSEAAKRRAVEVVSKAP